MYDIYREKGAMRMVDGKLYTLRRLQNAPLVRSLLSFVEYLHGD